MSYNFQMDLKSMLTIGAVGEKDLAVVARKDLLHDESWSGIREMNEDELFSLLNQHMVFRERTEELERDESLKQVIPYFLVRRGNSYLSARRNTKAGDSRVHGGRLVGFGGHLRAGDIKGAMRNWLEREFEEEIECEKVKDITYLGIINHDGPEDDGVHKVHFGLLFEIEVEGDARIKEQDNFLEEKFLPIEALMPMRDEMEMWSKLVLDFLNNKTK